MTTDTEGRMATHIIRATDSSRITISLITTSRIGAIDAGAGVGASITIKEPLLDSVVSVAQGRAEWIDADNR